MKHLYCLLALCLLLPGRLLAQYNQVPDNVEVAALQQLYYDTNGSGWSNSTNWLNGQSLSDVATWAGVTVSNGDVTGLNLGSNNLAGNVAGTIGQLAALQTLNLSYNQLTGSLPDELGQLVNLQTLQLSHNQFTQQLPGSLSNLTQLLTLDVGYNNLDGKLPALNLVPQLWWLDVSHNQLQDKLDLPTLSSSSNLVYLDLSFNQLAGQLSGDVANFSSLEYLNVEHNSLGGGLPKELGSLSALYYFDASTNQLTGSIPDALGGAAALTYLYLSHNQLKGALPYTVWKLSALDELALDHNDLSGPLPAGIEQLANLTALDISYNEFTGPLPAGIGQLTALQYLDASYNQLQDIVDNRLTSLGNVFYMSLANNKLSGDLPANFGSSGQWSKLTYLDLSGNQLTGNLPGGLSSTSVLNYLDLSANQFTGNLPASLGNLTKLHFLYLDHNQFIGSLPAGLQDLWQLEELNLSTNQLSGSLPDGSQWLTLTHAHFDDNQFSGTVPAGLLAGPKLQYLWLGHNHLTSLPPFSYNASLVSLRMEANHLSFGDLEPYFTGPGAGRYADFRYVDQTLPADERILSVATGQPWSLSSTAGGTRSHYQWQNAPLSGGWQSLSTTTATYQRSAAVAGDAGRYQCAMVNDWVVGVTLYSPVTTVRVQQALPPDNPSTDADRNWTLERTYDGNGELTSNVVSESKQFVDELGRPTQAQARNAATQQAFAEQTIYNSGGQAVLQTLAAPTNNQSFAYKTDFVTAGTTAYGPANFEGAKAGAPDAVDNTVLGTLGYYFSKNNVLEPLTPVTSYPYSLTEPYAGPLGGTKRAAAPGDELRMGKGREAKGRAFLVRQEFDNYLALRAQFVPGSTATTLEYQAEKSISVDADGREGFVVTNKEGQAIISGLSGAQYTALPVAGYLTAETPPTADPNAPAYVDIHIPAAGNKVVTFEPKSSAAGSLRIVDLLTDASYDYPITSAVTSVTPAAGSYAYTTTGANTQVTLPPGFYRFVSLTGTQRYAYEAHYGNLSYTYYDEASRVVATVAPNGLAGNNLLRNPGFEQDPLNAGAPSAWLLDTNSSPASGFYGQAGLNGNPAAHGGQSYGVHWTGQAGGHNLYSYQVLSQLPAGNYTARAWVKNTSIDNSSASEVAQLVVKGYSGTNPTAQLTVNIPVTGGSGNWVQVEIPNIAVSSGQCQVGILSVSPRDEWVIFDDMQFVRQADVSTPTFVTRNTYDTSSRLLTTESNDGGRADYVYARDGRIRFSQSALQRPAGRFSYSNYDEIGRVVESGEYTPAASGTASVEFESHGTSAVKQVGESLLLEAEKAHFRDNAGSQPYPVASASNGYEVAFLQVPGNYIRFDVPATGQAGASYELQVRYSNGMSNSRTLTLNVSGGQTQQVPFPPTLGWDKFATVRIPVTLQGSSPDSIRLDYTTADNGNINVDYLRVTPPLLQEAEEATFVNSNGSLPADAPTASGGRYVDYLTTTGNYVEFELTPPAGKGGLYELQFGYATALTSTRTMTLRVGNGSGKQVSFLPTGGWGVMSVLHTTATLVGGATNKVRLELTSTDNGSLNLDYLRAVAPVVMSARQEAESASFANTNNNQPNNVSAASGGQDVGYLTSVGTNVQFSLTVPQPGDYTLSLRYATGGSDTRTMSLLVNEAPARQVALPGTNGWTQFTTFTTTATLRAGTNVIQLRYGPADSGLVDLDYLQADYQLTPLAHDQSVQDLLEDHTRSGGLAVARCSQRKMVWYDLPFDGSTGSQGNDAQLNGRQQQFVTGAVAKTKNDNVTTWYSYDELGRVTWVVQDIVGVGVKTLDYQYDFSGNVLQVAYQQGQPDRFYHYYAYDAAQRLSTVHTSPDGVNRTLQAEYSYYLHGPLKRVQLASNLQGVDYTYTLQGTLKNLNHVNPTLEPGHDSPSTTGVYKDLFALTLDYFSGDYASRDLDAAAPTGSNVPTRYDGTIQGAAWRTAASADIQRVVYRYDEKSQLQNSTFGKVSAAGTATQFTPSLLGAFQEGGLTYDLNGNIQSLRRTSQTGAVTDNFSYSYKPNTNQLKEVHTGSPSGATVLSYDYDEIGQMTRQTDEQGARYFTYDVTGKTTGVYYDQAHQQPVVTFAYDDRGFRVSKTVYPAANVAPASTTYYVRDVAGNVLAIYEQAAPSAAVQRSEVPLYGSGRLGVMTHVADGTASGSDDYRYELNDHLGDARVVFHRPTTTTDVETMEPSGVPARAAFLNDNLYRVYRTRPGVIGGNFVARLTGSQPYGQELKRTLTVLKGDTITFSALGLLEDAVAARTSNLAQRVQPYLLLGAATPASDQPTTNETGQRAASAGPGKWLGRFVAGLSFTLGGHRSKQAAPNGQGARTMQAWIRYQLYDDQGNPSGSPVYTYLTGASGWEQVRLGVRVPQNGSIEVMAGTNSGNDATAYFDNLTVEQTGGLIIQEQHQYAFGAPLPGLSYTVGGVKHYRYGYQGQYAEHDAETGLESFELRMYSSRVGRWLNTDPKGQFSSPYLGMGNNAVSGIDPDGGDAFLPTSTLRNACQDILLTASCNLPEAVIIGKNALVAGGLYIGRSIAGPAANALRQQTSIERTITSDPRSREWGPEFKLKIARALAPEEFGPGGRYYHEPGLEPVYPEHFLIPAFAEFRAASAVEAIAYMDGSTVLGTDLATEINSANLVAEDGVHQVLIHGTADGFIKDGVQITAKDLAREMLQSGYQRGTPIRLISCNTGVYADGAAYQLSRYLRAPVLAPNAPVGVLPGGAYFLEKEILKESIWKYFYNGTVTKP